MSENRFFETMQRQAGEIQTGSNVEIISKNVVFNDAFTEITSYEPITIEEFNKIADGTANLQLVTIVIQEEVPINVTLLFKNAMEVSLPEGMGRQITGYSITEYGMGNQIATIILSLYEGNITLTTHVEKIPKINLSSAEITTSFSYISGYTSNGETCFFPVLSGNPIGVTFLISDKDWTNNSITLTPSSASEFKKRMIGIGRNYLLEISFKNEVYGNICIIIGAASSFTSTQSFILYPTDNNQVATAMLVTIKSSYISDTKSLKLEFFVNKTFGSGTYTNGLEDFKSMLDTITPYIL